MRGGIVLCVKIFVGFDNICFEYLFLKLIDDYVCCKWIVFVNELVGK